MSERRPRHSLGRSLLAWFLLLALLPLTINAWLGYRQAADGLMAVTVEELEQSAKLKAQLIQSWFDYRFMDLSSQAESQHNAKFLAVLRHALERSEQPADQFVNSHTWSTLVDEWQQDLITFARRYDYLYDLFLIDRDGNILFSVEREFDLGSNLFDGPYAATRFAEIAKASLETGQALFSDFESYSVSSDFLSGFLSAPLRNEAGDTIGVFAIQLELERIRGLMLGHSSGSSLQHYLVGEDGFLRTPLAGQGMSSVLRQRIDTEQFRRWQHDQVADGLESVITYRGPGGQPVIGLHQSVQLPGVSWVLISEIERDNALAAAHRLGWVTLAVFLLTATLATLLAIYQARRITRPIARLADASRAVAAGELDQHVVVEASNEIGLLADAFNEMLDVRKQHMDVLEESNDIAQVAMAELAEQKFALDQHAIVAITDMCGTITFANKKFSEVSGYRRAELLGQNHRMLNSGHHDRAFFRDMYLTITRGEVWHGEVCNRAKDGHLYWVDTTVVPFMDEDNKPQSYIAIRTDITERKRTETALLEAKEAAEAATRQKSEFLANMSHEIRTPMNGIIGMTGLLLDTSLTPKQRSYVDATQSSADALLTIINDILDFSKIEAGKLELEAVPFDLQLLAEDVAELMALQCRKKGIEMLLRFKPGTQRFVVGDPGRVRQILLNLLSNAIKFTEQGHVLLTLESYGGVAGMTPILLTVQDTGIGIAKEKLDRIFNKFDQEDGSTTRKYGGTGLGLSICKQLCHMMEGDIQVHSQQGVGSTFSFTLNLGVGEAALPASSYADGDVLLDGLNVLVVDDNAVARMILTEQLSALGVRTCAVASAPLAIEALQQSIADSDPFSMLIVDAHVPEMDGEALAAEISQRKLMAHGAMVYVTSQPRQGDGSRVRALGFDGYLAQPLHPSEVSRLLALIQSAKQQGRDAPLVTRHTLQEAEEGVRRKPLFTGAQILLSEDNPVNVMVATELLEGYGCKVTPAGNGLEALALVEARRFDLIFMDCQMPEMDGFDATAQIRTLQTRNATERTPIVAFTANAMKSDEDRCFDAGMDDFITKPVSQKLLEGVLIKWLPHKQQQGTAPAMAVVPSAEGDVSSAEPEGEALDLLAFNKLKQLFGDKFAPVVEQHTQSALKNLNLAQSAIEQGDLETLERAAHSIKGASAQFGAARLRSAAAEVEALAKKGVLDDMARLVDELQSAQEQAAQLMLEQLDELESESSLG